MEEWRPWSSFGGAAVLEVCSSLCIVDETSCDALPLVHSLLGRTLRASEGTTRLVLLSLQRPTREWLRTSRRLGYDLNLAAIQGRLLSLKALQGGTGGGPRFVALDLLEETMETNAVERIKEFASRPVILVDGLDALLTIAEWPIARVMRFTRVLETLAGRLVIRVTNGPRMNQLIRWLVHRSARIVVWRGLISSSGGSTAQVHGQLTIYPLEEGAPPSYLFKCSESALLLQSKFIDPLLTSLEDAVKG